MSELRFEPFQDRKSRDIRNQLSSAFVISLKAGDEQELHRVSVSFLNEEGLASVYEDYIHDRLVRYKNALKVIREKGVLEDYFFHGMVLWDQQLFFEVHEVLEHAWYDAVGEEKLVLQALIRAAGVFIKKEFGYEKQASKIAAKAHLVLKDTRLLEPYCDITVLLEALSEPIGAPPKLLGTV